jgi:hypothetical protein
MRLPTPFTSPVVITMTLCLISDGATGGILSQFLAVVARHDWNDVYSDSLPIQEVMIFNACQDYCFVTDNGRRVRPTTKTRMTITATPYIKRSPVFDPTYLM